MVANIIRPAKRTGNIIVRSDERAAFVGKTGSGKSFLANHAFVKALRRVVVFDPKGDIGPEWNLEPPTRANIQAIRNGQPVRVRIPPQMDGDWREWLELIYQAGQRHPQAHITLYIDEMYLVVPPGKRPPELLTALYTTGRALGIGVWAATQRPSWVPMIMFSEAEWFFVFRLSMADDRKRAAGFTTQEIENPVRNKHGFYVYNVEWEQSRYFTQYTGGN